MAEPTYAITGVHTGIGSDGKIPVRQDIDILYKKSQDGDTTATMQIDLFLQAFLRFQQQEPQDKLSYFQIAGIHGMPLVPWDEAIFRDVTPERVDRGYCNHNSVIFPTWHRPYVALVEQRIHEIMTDLVQEYPAALRPEYQEAADTWRLPYWDWARTNDVPELAKPVTVTVQSPKSPYDTIPNPLYKFTCPGQYLPGQLGISYIEDEDYFGPFNIAKSTSRYPPDANQKQPDPAVLKQWSEGFVDNEQVKNAITQNQSDPVQPELIREWVSRIFGQTDWITFATTLEKVPQGGNNNSLEAVHNAMHGYTGGAGHMGFVPVAAFDPIFWLHHCNIDRLLALWQAYHPDAWFDDVSQQAPEGGNFVIAPGEAPTPATKLHPFHKDTIRTLYTSDDIRDWTTLGYTYPYLPKSVVNIIHDGDPEGLTQLRKQINREINKYYPTRKQLLKNPVYKLSEDSESSESSVSHNDFLVSIIYSRFDYLNGAPYYVHIFIGKEQDTVGKPANTWLNNEGLVGSIYTFSTRPENSGSGPSGCENCTTQQKQHLLSVAQIPITNALVRWLEKGQRRDDIIDHPEGLTPEFILPALGKYRYLHWGATSVNGELIPLSKLPSLRVFLSSGTITHYEDLEKLSHYGDYTIHPEVTKDRKGGYRDLLTQTLPIRDG